MKTWVRVLELAGGSDSVELKLTIPAEQHRSTVADLGIDPIGAQIRLVSFFDTPDLTLNKAGLLCVRARRVAGREDDSVVKLRPVEPDDLPEHLRKSPNLVVELDAMPGGYVCSASMKARLGLDDASAPTSASGHAASCSPRSSARSTTGTLPRGSRSRILSCSGRSSCSSSSSIPRSYASARWSPRCGCIRTVRASFELSTKCAPADMFQVANEARGYLTAKGVDVGGEQTTKTATALGYFAEHLTS